MAAAEERDPVRRQRLSKEEESEARQFVVNELGERKWLEVSKSLNAWIARGGGQTGVDSFLFRMLDYCSLLQPLVDYLSVKSPILDDFYDHVDAAVKCYMMRAIFVKACHSNDVAIVISYIRAWRDGLNWPDGEKTGLTGLANVMARLDECAEHLLFKNWLRPQGGSVIEGCPELELYRLEFQKRCAELPREHRQEVLRHIWRLGGGVLNLPDYLVLMQRIFAFMLEVSDYKKESFWGSRRIFVPALAISAQDPAVNVFAQLVEILRYFQLQGSMNRALVLALGQLHGFLTSVGTAPDIVAIIQSLQALYDDARDDFYKGLLTRLCLKITGILPENVTAAVRVFSQLCANLLLDGDLQNEQKFILRSLNPASYGLGVEAKDTVGVSALEPVGGRAAGAHAFRPGDSEELLVGEAKVVGGEIGSWVGLPVWRSLDATSPAVGHE